MLHELDRGWDVTIQVAYKAASLSIMHGEQAHMRIAKFQDGKLCTGELEIMENYLCLSESNTNSLAAVLDEAVPLWIEFAEKFHDKLIGSVITVWMRAQEPVLWQVGLHKWWIRNGLPQVGLVTQIHSNHLRSLGILPTFDYTQAPWGMVKQEWAHRPSKGVSIQVMINEAEMHRQVIAWLEEKTDAAGKEAEELFANCLGDFELQIDEDSDYAPDCVDDLGRLVAEDYAWAHENLKPKDAEIGDYIHLGQNRDDIHESRYLEQVAGIGDCTAE